MTKLSLVAALAVSSAFAGGDIAPVEPVVAAPVESMTTINGKLTGYYYTDDASDDMFGSDASQLGLAATLDVTHKFTQNIAANFSAVGYLNTNDTNYFNFENQDNGAIFNVANITATFADTTFVLGRQLLATPMLGGFDWLLAPGSFEAYTAVNNSFENITLVGSYIRTWRPNNTGDNFINLTDIDDGNNWTVGATYDNETISANIWYYNVDAAAAGVLSNGIADTYGQVYVDAGYNFGIAKVEALYVNTNYDVATDSNAYGAKVSATFGTFNFMGAYVNVDDNLAGFVGTVDTLYTSSWNSSTVASLGDNFKIEAGTEFAGISASASYAYYEYAQKATATEDNDGSEIDVILGYNITDTIDLNVVYTNTDYGHKLDNNNNSSINALEVYANYKF